MYHNNYINQVLNLEKSLLNSSFSHKDSQTDHYLSKCTPTERNIGKYIYQYQKSSWIKLSNATISKAIGCSERTVRRATAKFHKDGFIRCCPVFKVY